MREVLELRGFQVIRSVPRFLPYTMVGRTPPLWLVVLYLRVPFVWPLFGRQFFITARRERLVDRAPESTGNDQG